MNETHDLVNHFPYDHISDHGPWPYMHDFVKQREGGFDCTL